MKDFILVCYPICSLMLLSNIFSSCNHITLYHSARIHQTIEEKRKKVVSEKEKQINGFYRPREILEKLQYLNPNIKRGNISEDEEQLIIRMHRLLGNGYNKEKKNKANPSHWNSGY